MSKHKKKWQSPQPPPAAQQPASAGQSAAVEASPAAQESERQASTTGVSGTYFILFWALIVAAVALAWTLGAMLPNIRESVIERWIMLGLAAALGILLFIFR